MSDIYTKRKRSEVMAAVKGQGSRIEKRIGVLLKEYGVRYRSHSRTLPGKPDFYFTRLKTVLFVDSCYWHGCKKHGTMPKNNAVFWKKKIARNVERDREINHVYKKMGWRVLRVWEHDLRAIIATRVLSAVQSLVQK